MDMKVNLIRNITIASLITMPSLFSASSFAQVQNNDTFERTISPAGCRDSLVLANAPSPFVSICDEPQTAAIVVDLERNLLYKYNKLGEAEDVYLIASGAKSTPTHKGVRIVSHVERFPYRGAPRHTKRRRNPRAYGPNVIILNKLNPNDGTQSSIGEFIHGNNDSTSIGKYISNGCMRMDNDVIKQLSSKVKSGDIVVIK